MFASQNYSLSETIAGAEPTAAAPVKIAIMSFTDP